MAVLSGVVGLLDPRHSSAHAMADSKAEAGAGTDHLPEFNDSEAETEQLHESPVKKRLAEEIAMEEAKKAKLAGREFKPAKNGRSHHVNGFSGSPKSIQAPDEPEDASKNGNFAALRNGTSENEFNYDEYLDEGDDQGDGEDHEENEDDQDDENGDEQDEEGNEKESNEERIKAIEALTEIEVSYSKIRDHLHDQQLAKFDLEIMMCSEGTHPDLKHYYAQIDEERDERLRRNRSLLCYQMNAIYNQSNAARCSAYQTFLKNKFQLRNDMLNCVTQKWYQINCERRLNTSASPQFGYVAFSPPYNAKRPTVQSMGISTYKKLLDMPAAPHMSKVTESETEEDLRNIGLR